MTPSLPADIMEHWPATCEENQVQEQLSEQGKHNEALTLPRAAARSKRQDISKMDEQEAKEASAQAATRQRQQLFTNPRKAHAIIFRKGVQMGRHLALLDSDTKRITEDPRSMIRIVKKHLADAQKHPHGIKQALTCQGMPIGATRSQNRGRMTAFILKPLQPACLNGPGSTTLSRTRRSSTTAFDF